MEIAQQSPKGQSGVGLFGKGHPNPSPPASGLRSAVTSPVGPRAELQSPSCFPIF